MNNHRKADYAAALLLEKIVRDTYSVRDPGYIQPLQQLLGWAREHGAISVIDGAQAAPHLPLDVRALG